MKDYFNKERAVYVAQTTDGRSVCVSYRPPLTEYLREVITVVDYLLDLPNIVFHRGNDRSKQHKARVRGKKEKTWIDRNSKNTHKHHKTNKRHNPDGYGGKKRW